MLLLEQFKLKEQREWERARWLGWSNAKFKAKHPKDIFPLEIDKRYKTEHKKDEERAKAAFDKYKQIEDAKNKGNSSEESVESGERQLKKG